MVHDFEGQTITARADELVRLVKNPASVASRLEDARALGHRSAESAASHGRWDAAALDLLAAEHLNRRAQKARESGR